MSAATRRRAPAPSQPTVFEKVRPFIDLRSETATVRREPALVSNAVLAAAVAVAGYKADLATAVTVPLLEIAASWNGC